MNVLVTGGAGHIGSSLASSLIDKGHKVRVLDRRSPGSMTMDSRCEYMRGDLLKLSDLDIALHKIEAVYHLAWSFYSDDYRLEIEENLIGTLNLLDACKASGVDHFIFASSAVVYGPTGITPACEGDPCNPQESTIGGPAYGTTKLACEKYSLACQREGLPVTIMRIHGVFSQDRLDQFSEMIEQAREGKDIPVVYEAGGQYAHLDDVVSALCLVPGRDLAFGQVFNVAGNRIYQDRDIAEYIRGKACTGSRIVLMSEPGQRMISVSIDKLSRRLGYIPRQNDFLREFINACFPCRVPKSHHSPKQRPKESEKLGSN